MSIERLRHFLNVADATDYREGMAAYFRYNHMMEKLADLYGFDKGKVTAAFAALSPNNDYTGNLRSLVSVMAGINAGFHLDEITVSTYKACRDRAYTYLTGDVDFLTTVKGPKITAFYHNIICPMCEDFVTIDGHMVAAYRGSNGTMKDNIPRRAEYREIVEAVKALSEIVSLIPNQVQAIIWFARKRTLNVVYDAQLDLFGSPEDMWKTIRCPKSIKPFTRTVR